MRLGQIDGKTQAQTDFLYFRFPQPQVPGLRKDAAHTCAPLFDQVEFLENAGDDRIANAGGALFHLFDGQAGQENAHAFHLDAVIQENDPNGGAALGVIAVHQGVDDHLAQDSQGDAPDIPAAHFGEIRSAVGVLFQEQHNLVNSLRQRYVNIDVIENVDFLGYRRDINNLVGLSDLSVASSFQEGLPINLIEAMAMGNPIVATDVRGNNDAVEDGVNGYLVPVGDSGTMAEKILGLMNDREKLRTFGENGLDMVRGFSTENVNREMLTIYSNLGLI